MPKLFTDKDVVQHQFAHIYTTNHREELLDAPLPWQRMGLQQTASGYGAKLTTNWKINFNGKLYRVYATCYGNAASNWFTVKGRKIYVD